MMLTNSFENLTPAILARLPFLSRLAFDVAFIIAGWQMRSATRRSLGKLDRHLLWDIGLEADAARHEVTKHFWQT